MTAGGRPHAERFRPPVGAKPSFARRLRKTVILFVGYVDLCLPSLQIANPVWSGMRHL
jgi:hypothetical protein